MSENHLNKIELGISQTEYKRGWTHPTSGLRKIHGHFKTYKEKEKGFMEENGMKKRRSIKLDVSDMHHFSRPG